ncbi:18097_t:CDS:2, partial [Racocetra fulgida]
MLKEKATSKKAKAVSNQKYTKLSDAEINTIIKDQGSVDENSDALMIPVLPNQK